MTSRVLAAVATMAASAVLIGGPAVAGVDRRGAASLSVTTDRTGSTLSIVGDQRATGARLFAPCGTPASLLTGLGLGLDLGRIVSIPSGCDQYALTIDPAVQSR